MNQRIWYFFPILLLWSCATFTKHENETYEIELDQAENKIKQKLYLIGNVGKGDFNGRTQALETLRTRLAQEEANTSVLFLGNQVAKMNTDSIQGKKWIHSQLEPIVDAMEDCECNPLLIPGNEDWQVHGLKGLKIQEKYLTKHLGKDHFLPSGGCPIKRIMLSEDVVLITIDANWYIVNWDKYPNMNVGCKINTRDMFMGKLSDYLRQGRGKTTIVAMSRPVMSNGEYGGKFSAKSDVLPLPILGNIKNLIRKTSGFHQSDMSFKYYNDLNVRIKSLAKQNEKVIIVSGHEANMQYLIQNEIPQIISGSFQEKSPTQNAKNTIFSYGKEGYAVLDVMEDGSSQVKFHSWEDEEPLYTGKVYSKIKEVDSNYPILHQDSIKASIFTKKEAHKGKVYEFLIGKRYRQYYGKEIESKVAYLDTLKGGLTPVRLGGGHQSESVQLEDQNGMRYVMRAMKKNSAQYMQTVTFRDFYMEDQLNNTISEKLVQDFFTGSYPYSVLLAEGLSEYVEIPTKNSKVYYIPKQKALENYNANNGGKLYVFEDHPKEGKYQLGAVPFEGKVLSTYDLLHEIQKDESNKVDQKSYVKARLFDMLIGDWDRHQDQWKWLEYKQDGESIYRPLPRDRDQAFSIMGDGFIAKITLFLVPYARMFEPYSGKLKAINQFNMEPFPLDVTLLPDMSLEDWMLEAEYLQTQLTDEAIDQVFASLPSELQDKNLDKLKDHLKERRGNITDMALRYYNRVAKYSKVMGTDKDDYFKIEIKPDHSVELSVYRKKDGTYTDRFHHRVYFPEETNALWLYGLDDKDTFEVIGSGNRIKLVLVGGLNNDEYIIPERNRVHIYDYKSKKNEVSNAKANKHLKDDYNSNRFDFEHAYESNFQLFPIIAANQDVGTQLGVTLSGYKTTFKGKTVHSFSGEYYTATGGVSANYSLSAPQVIGRYNLFMNALYNNQEYTMNFFGWGNETVNLQDSLELNYNRVKMTGFHLTPNFARSYHSGWSLSAGLNYFNMKLQEAPLRISENNNDIPEYLFDNNNFLGLTAGASYDNKDYKAFPTNGLNANLSLNYTENLNQSNKGILKISPSIGIDTRLSSNGRFVLASKVFGDILIGDNYEFFQSATLGSNMGLRGYRNDRFSGKYSFAQTTDIRWSFKRGKTFIIPMRLGMYAGVDYGRVWVENDTSKKWHNSYGGGLFMIFAESGTMTLSSFHAEEGFKMMLDVGFSF